ncbi:MAG TPA: HD domain-containing phosphohydrolase [Pyrinomonadaceae bacterium]|nr:HD domain-containing phosphohydrolase [Pyrinomonadaceae bacterium]
MSRTKETRKSLVYQSVITFAGISLWLWSLVGIGLSRTGTELLTLLAVLPLVLAASVFPITFPSPAGAKVTSNKISFTLTDALVFLVACLYGSVPAILLAGIEGFVGSRRAIKRLSSNLFSASMMALAAGSAAIALGAVLRHGFGEAAGETRHTFLAVALALLTASLVHLVVNVGLLSTLFALRLDSSIISTVKRNLLWAVPMFVPTGTAASLMFVALEQGVAVVVVIGAPVLLAVYFVHRQYRDSVQERIQLIEKANRERLEATEKAHRQTIEALAVAINAKDEVTHEHVLRVQIYAAGVARLLGCTESEVEALKAGALLHDIGKIAVPDYILNKPGKLTAAEFDKMKLHTIAGAQILGRVEFPYPVVPVVRSHHERWDGRGYPDGLRGEAIPLTARILSVVDCFDAVREDRQYRKGLTRAEAIDLIMQGSGTQYDPRVVGTFVTHLPEFEAEIQAHRDAPLPTFGIEPLEDLSDAARSVTPAAGLASETNAGQSTQQTASTANVKPGDEAEHEVLSHLTRAFDSARSLEELSHALTDNLARIVPFETCALTLAPDATGEHRVVHAFGLNAALLVGRTITTGDGVTGWALANRKPFCNTDPKLDLPAALAANFAAYQTLAVFPLVKDDELHGALTLYSASLKEYDAHHQRLLQQVAALFTAALSDIGKRAAQPAAVFNLAPSPLQLAPLESELTH